MTYSAYSMNDKLHVQSRLASMNFILVDVVFALHVVFSCLYLISIYQ